MKIGSVLVTGANRGIGLEFVRQFSKLEDPPNFIFATYRDVKTLQDLKDIQDSSVKSRVILIKMDITMQKDIDAVKQVIEQNVGDRGLNLLINNAGFLKPLGFPVPSEDLEVYFKTNTVGSVMVLQTLIPLLEIAASVSESKGMSIRKAAVVNISSMSASILKTGVEFLMDLAVPCYKISKAALNMATRVIAANVKDKEILVFAMCPGLVKTGRGRHLSEIEPEESIADMIQTFSKLNETHQGSYIDRFANTYPF